MTPKDDEQQQQQPPPLHILFFPFLVPGHLIPMADMAALFAARGVRCTILTTPVQASMIHSIVNRASSNDDTSSQAIHVAVVPFPDVGLPPAAQSGTGLVSQGDKDKFHQVVELLREPFERFLADCHADVDAVVSDGFYYWSVDVAAAYGVPRLMFLGMSMFAQSCAESALSQERSRNPDDDDPDAVVTLSGLPHRVELRRSQMMKEAHFLAFFRGVYAAGRRSYGELFNSFQELEQDTVEHYRTTLCGVRRIRHPDQLLAGAATGARPRPRPLRQDLCVGHLRRRRGIVRPMDARRLPDSFAWAHHPWLGRWAPQVLILNHPAVGCFVTHCGWNSTLEAMNAGVPMVTWPRYADQFYNEKLVVDVLELGVSVGAKDYASSAEPEAHRVIGGGVIAESVRRVMEVQGEAIRKKAQDLGAKARNAVEKGGSSYCDAGRLVDELMARRSPQRD